MARASASYQREKAIDRASRFLETPQPVWGVLGKITGIATIAGTTYRNEYTWSEAIVGPSSANYVCATRPSGQGIVGEKAISISELGNTSTTVSGGVLLSNLPSGFTPKPLPIGTPVWVVPNRASDGTLIWIILSHQAIDGECPSTIEPA